MFFYAGGDIVWIKECIEKNISSLRLNKSANLSELADH